MTDRESAHHFIDPIRFLEKKLAEDDEFIAGPGHYDDYPQHARVQFIRELIKKYEDWDFKASEWGGREDYCNVRAGFLYDLLEVIANHWGELAGEP